MVKKKTTTTKKNKRKNYEYVGKFYVCCAKPLDIKKMSCWLANNATLDIDFESDTECPFDDGVGIAIAWDTLKETK